VAVRAENIERELGTLDETLSREQKCVSGTVRVTAVPAFINRILVPAIPGLLKRHPDLQIELHADSRNYSVSRGEADLAIRFARPRNGGTRVRTRRIGTMIFGAYASASDRHTDAHSLPWVTYPESMSRLPQARWIKAACTTRTPRASVRLNDLSGVLEAVAAGIGRSLLPCRIADPDPRLRRIDAVGAAMLVREVWLLLRSGQIQSDRIRVVAAWIENVLKERSNS
jgi:DNA-binding transcriptional LysR family regulator